MSAPSRSALSALAVYAHVLTHLVSRPCTGQQDKELMKELVESAARKVNPGMVRRKKEKGPKVQPKGLGFGAPAPAGKQ